MLQDDAALPLNIKNRVTNADGEPAGSFTRSVLSLPATKRNNSILDGVLDFLPFRIEINGAPKLAGLLQVKAIRARSNCYGCAPEFYEVALFGGNTNLFKLLQGIKLKDVSEAILEFDAAPILAGFNADPNTENAGFCLIKWHEWQNSKKVSEPDINGNPQKRPLEMPSYYEATPFLFIKPLIIAAFDSIGYTIQSAFFDTDYFSRLIMPVPLPPKLPAEYSEAYLNFEARINAPFVTVAGVPPFLAYMPLDNIIKLPSKNPAAWNPVLYEYTVPETGFYEIELGATFIQPELNPPDSDFLAGIQVNGVLFGNANDVYIWFGDAFTVSPRPYPTGLVKDSRVYKFNKGDIIKCFYFLFTPPVGVDSFYMRITGEAELAQGVSLDLSTMIKGDFIDLFKDIQILHNLIIDTNADTKTAIIEPADNYLNTSAYPIQTSENKNGFYSLTEAVDYTRKIDYTKDVELVINDLAGFTFYEYLSDDDDTTKERENAAELPIYGARFDADNGADKGKRDEIKTEFFAKTIHARDVLARYPNTAILPQFPLIYPQNYLDNPTALPSDANKDVTPRLLWFGGQRGGIDGYIMINENQGTPTETPAAFMVNYNDVTGLDASLAWSNEVINGEPVAGLVERFYLHSLKRKLLRTSKAAAVLQSSIDRDLFTFRKKAIINDRRYIVAEVDILNPLTSEPDKFLFILDDYASEADAAKVASSIVAGVVQLE